MGIGLTEQEAGQLAQRLVDFRSYFAECFNRSSQRMYWEVYPKGLLSDDLERIAGTIAEEDGMITLEGAEFHRTSSL